MHAIDYAILVFYMLGMVVLGVAVARRGSSVRGYFVGERPIGSGHLGLSIAATDVGGGFSIGLGGLGFTLGLSGSWLLFTGLLGAWITAVVLVPRVKPLGDRFGWTSYGEFLEHRYDARVRLLASFVSALGYTAFVGGQVLAGAKLAAVAFEVDVTVAVMVMASVIVLYTTLGGLSAVVLTDTVQWWILLLGLGLFALPLAWQEVGGLPGLQAALPEGHLSLLAASPGQLALWLATIVPIWFVANTLYQRMYAARDVAQAQRAWYFAGLLEWPCMGLLGAFLGVLARVLFPGGDPESAVPLLIREVLPVGATGLVLAAYFAAIMSTADSCLLAAVGHLTTDFDARFLRPDLSDALRLRSTRVLTMVVGFASVSVALWLPSVLEVIMLSYGFMVCGLFVPTLAGVVTRRASARGALWSIATGGSLAVLLPLLPEAVLGPLAGVPAVALALPLSLVVLLVLSPRGAEQRERPRSAA